jgi:hypothetical protein
MAQGGSRIDNGHIVANAEYGALQHHEFWCSSLDTGSFDRFLRRGATPKAEQELGDATLGAWTLMQRPEVKLNWEPQPIRQVNCAEYG